MLRDSQDTRWRTARVYQWVAVVHVTTSAETGEIEIAIEECDAPRPLALLNVAAFREAATAKAVPK